MARTIQHRLFPLLAGERVEVIPSAYDLRWVLMWPAYKMEEFMREMNGEPYAGYQGSV